MSKCDSDACVSYSVVCACVCVRVCGPMVGGGGEWGPVGRYLTNIYGIQIYNGM